MEHRHIRDELDTRVVFVPRGTRLMAAALIIVLLAIGAWSVLGSVPTKVAGNAIILHADQETHWLQSSEAASIVALKAGPGDPVKAGDVIAELSLPSLELELQLARGHLDELKARMTATQQRFAAELSERQKLTEDEIKALSQAADAFQQQADGLSPDDAGYQAAILQVNDLAVRIAAIRSQLFEVRTEQAAALEDMRQQVLAREQEVKDLESRIATASQIKAPAAGSIGEIRTQVGQVVGSGDVLLTVVSAGEGYEAIALFPIDVGGRVLKDMTVHVIPNTVKQDEYGAMEGRVLSISDGPVTPAGAAPVVGSTSLTEDLSDGTVVYVARIELSPDSHTPSGFAWTSGVGPPFAVSAGTPATVDVVVSEAPPIALVVPALRQMLTD